MTHALTHPVERATAQAVQKYNLSKSLATIARGFFYKQRAEDKPMTSITNTPRIIQFMLRDTLEAIEMIDPPLLDDIITMAQLKQAANDNHDALFTAEDWINTSEEIKQAINKMLQGDDFTATAAAWFTTPKNIKTVVAYVNKKAPIITGKQPLNDDDESM
jgi:hypothetical protein